MPSRVFNEEEKKEIKDKLLDIGFPMLKKYGLVHMSVPKIAEAAGIATGTFYRFFKSKEYYIYQLIVHQRSLLLSQMIPDEVKAGKRKLTKDEVRSFILLIVDKDRSIYANLKLSDEEKLFKDVENFSPNIQKEQQLSEQFLNMIDSPKDKIDFAVVSNLIKVLAITSEAKDELHEEGYARTVTLIIDMILGELYM